MNEAPPTIIYEQAVNERMRTFLRIDFLARQFEYHYAQPSLWGTRATVATLLEFVSLISRHNIKIELIRELDQRLAWLEMLSSSGQCRPGSPERNYRTAPEPAQRCA